MTCYNWDSHVRYSYDSGMLRTERLYPGGYWWPRKHQNAPETRDRAYYAQKYYLVYMEAMVQAERDLTVPADRYRRLLHMYNVYNERCRQR